VELQLRIGASDVDRQTLRGLTERLERVREDERTALARELHDEFGQALTGLKMDLSAMRKALGPAANRTVRHPQAMIDTMDGVVDAALDSIERIVSELRPAVLDRLGCVAGAEWLVSQFEKRTGLRTRFDVDPDLEPSQESGTAVFRILQEALTNISRHAHASSVDVELHLDANDLVLRVADDGVGMTHGDRENPTAFGLKGIAERVRALNGSLTFGPPPGGGTQLVVRVPAAARWTRDRVSARQPGSATEVR
jgi:two-component system sensor kinase